jgi:hypothetical protein
MKIVAADVSPLTLILENVRANLRWLLPLCLLLLLITPASAAIVPYEKNVLTTNALTLGTNLTLVSGVLEASGSGGDTIWTNTPAGSVQLLAPTNYLALGVSADTWFGTSTNNLLVGVHDATAGDPPVAIFNIAAVDDAASVTNWADIYFRGDSANGQANFSIDSFNGVTSTIFNLSMTPDDIIAALYAGGTARTILNPTVTSTGAAVAYTFDSKNVLTTGDSLATFKNAGVQIANLTPSGSLTLNGTTNQLGDSGSALTYNGVAIGTTITNSFGVHLDGGGLVLATGLAGYATIVNGGTIQSCVMLADQTGSAVVDIWRCTYGQFDAGSTHPVAGDKITSSAPPTITSAVKSTNALTGWSLSVTNGDVIAWSVTACTNITKLDISVTTIR